MARLFVFDHVWRVPAPPQQVFAALADVDAYPRWWPEIRSVERVDDERGRAEVRSMLPYTLHLELTREVDDERAGLLRVGIAGDLEGWASFLVEGDRTTAARYRQEVVVGARYLRRAAPLADPLLRLNHRWMMRSGERGLAAYVGR